MLVTLVKWMPGFYLIIAICVSRAIRNVGALTYVSCSVERAAMSAARAFVRGFRNLDKMGLCPISQDGFKLGRLLNSGTRSMCVNRLSANL